MADLADLVAKRMGVEPENPAEPSLSREEQILNTQPETYEQWEEWIGFLGGILEPGVGLVFNEEPLTGDHKTAISWGYELYCLGCGRKDDGSFKVLSERELRDLPRSFVIKASRAGGKTIMLSMVGFSLCRWNDNYCWNHTAAVREQAERAWGYMTRLRDSGKFDDMVKKFKEAGGYWEFTNGSEANVITGSEKGQNSKHPQFATFDEVEQTKISIVREGQLANIRKRTALGISLPPVSVYCSTQKKANETMFVLLNEAKKGKHKLIQADVFDVIERCGDWRTEDLPAGLKCADWDQINAEIDIANRFEHAGQARREKIQLLQHQRELLKNNCRLVEWCKGRAKWANGFYSIEDAIDKSKNKSYWLAQMMGQQPQMEHAIYSTFSEAENVSIKAIYRDGCRLGAGIDYGFMQDPTYFFLAAANGPFWDVFYEEEIENISAPKTPPLLRASLKKLMIDPDEVEFWAADPNATELVAAMIDDGFNAIRSLGKRSKQIKFGIDRVSELICDDGFCRLRIHPDCLLLIQSLQVYEKRPDGLPKSGQYDHPPDALRYFAVYIAKQDAPSGRTIHPGRLVGRTFRK